MAAASAVLTLIIMAWEGGSVRVAPSPASASVSVVDDGIAAMALSMVSTPAA